MKLKICGMKYQENMQAVATLQPDYLGFIFYKKSARYFNTHISDVPKQIKRTGVFVAEDIATVMDKIKEHNLSAVQLHGQESPAYCKQLQQELASVFSNGILPEIIKVFSIKDEFNFEVLTPFETVCDFFLFDTKGKLPGGNGYVFDWDLLSQYPSTKPYFLSGGIGIEEIPQLKSFLKSAASKYCYALDVNSKFEIEPGQKNIEKLETFIKNIQLTTSN